MTKSLHLFIVSAAMLGISTLAHAQVEPAARSTVNIGQGYATLNTPPTVGEYSFSEKSRIVQEAKSKRDAKVRRDKESLPPLTSVK